MYNQEEKQKFIDYKESQATLPENYLNRLFEYTQDIEYDLQLDIADCEESVIIECYKRKQSPSLHSLVVMNGRLAEYVDFCNRMQNTNRKNRFNNLTVDVLRTCIDEEKSKRRFIRKNDFYLDLNNLDNAVDKFVLTALYEGIKGKGFEHIWKLQLKDIGKESVRLSDGKELDLMDSKLYYFAHESAETFYYYTYGKTDAAVEMTGTPDQIIKTINRKQYLEISDDPVMIKRQDKNIFRKFERAANELGWEEIKPRTLLISGQIEYTKRISEKYGISVEETIRRPDLMQLIQNRFIKISDKESFLDATKYVLEESSSSG